MTDVLVDLVVSTVDGVNAPALGTLLVTPVRRYVDGAHVVLPRSYAQVLVGGQATLKLKPTTPGATAWRVEERVTGGGGTTRYVSVPATGPVAYKDLPDVDPRTLL